MKRKRVLFVCTGNAVRSQMAEALARIDWPDIIDPCSAGSNPAGWVHPLAIEAIADLGEDISEADSTPVSEFLDEQLDLVVLLCEYAASSCPDWPAAEVIERFVVDPTWAEGSDEERYQQFLARRDEIRDIIRNLVEENGWDKE